MWERVSRGRERENTIESGCCLNRHLFSILGFSSIFVRYGLSPSVRQSCIRYKLQGWHSYQASGFVSTQAPHLASFQQVRCLTTRQMIEPKLVHLSWRIQGARAEVRQSLRWYSSMKKETFLALFGITGKPYLGTSESLFHFLNILRHDVLARQWVKLPNDLPRRMGNKVILKYVHCNRDVEWQTVASPSISSLDLLTHVFKSWLTSLPYCSMDHLLSSVTAGHWPLGTLQLQSL